MIKVLNDIGKNVIGFELSGKVSGEDYEKVLIPTLKSELHKNDKLKVLYYVGQDFDSYDFSAMLDDAKAGFMFFLKWEKIAVVSDIGWIVDGVKIFSFTVPGEIKTFSNNQLQEAKQWLAKEDKKENIKVTIDAKTKIAILEPHSTLSKEDFAKAKEIIDPFMQKNDKLNGFIIYTKDFPGWNSFSAFLAHVRFIEGHQKHIKKLAFVTNSSLVDIGEEIGKHLVSPEVKKFDYNQLDSAKEWILS